MVARPDDLSRIVADLLRRVRDLETVARMPNASLRGGAFRVLDESTGDERVRLGELDGEYGLFVQDASVTLNLLRLARMQVQTVSTQAGRSSTGWGDLTSSSGPEVTVTTGERALVLLSANVVIQNGAAHGSIGYVVSGATSINTLGSSFERTSTHRVGVTLATSINRGVAFVAYFETGLNPGSNTFTAKYDVDDTTDVNFRDRTMIVIPF